MADINSMSFDGSSYLKPGQGRDPLDQILKTNEVIGQNEVGRGVQQAIQPDGTIDRNVLAQVLKGSVAGSMKAPQALNALETLRNAGYAADSTGLTNFHTRMELIRNSTQHLLDLAPTASPQQVKSALMNGFGYLLNPKNKGPEVGLTIPVIADAQKPFYDAKGQPKSAPEVINIAKQLATQAASTQEAIRMHLPGADNVDTGQRVVTAPTGSQMNPAIGRTIQKEISPDAVQPGSNLQPTFRGTQPPSTGTDVAMPSQRGQQPDITKRIVGYQGPPQGQLAQPGDGVQYGVPRGGPSALAPGQAEPLTVSGTAYAKDLADSRGYAERMNPLRQAIPLLEKSRVGPGTETIQHINAFTQAMGLPTWDEKKTINTAEAKKYLSQNAAAVAPPGTNIPSVLNAFEANPNMQQPKQAAVELSKMLYGLGRLRQASVLAFQKTGLPAGQYTDWASKWAPQQDIRGYMADLMTPDARKELLSKVKPGSPAAAKIAESYNTAKGLNLLGDVERP
jgi:hypothetical protein